MELPIKLQASDIHLEPGLNEVQVRMRVDGVLRPYMQVPKWLQNAVMSRLKVLAKLDIAERRRPQDGRIKVQFQRRPLDLRISTLPTHFGEKVVMRVLGSSNIPGLQAIAAPDVWRVGCERAPASRPTAGKTRAVLLIDDFCTHIAQAGGGWKDHFPTHRLGMGRRYSR